MKRLINVKYNGKEYRSKEKIGKDYKNQLQASKATPISHV